MGSFLFSAPRPPPAPRSGAPAGFDRTDLAGKELHALLFGLNVSGESLLPTLWYNDVGELAALGSMCEVRHIHFGARLSSMAMEVILEGFLKVIDLEDEDGEAA